MFTVRYYAKDIAETVFSYYTDLFNFYLERQLPEQE